MAEKYGFFDAVVTNGKPDRVYSADDINDIFKGILSDGVFRLYDNALNITAGTGLSVNINTGKAIVKNHWYINTTVKNLVLTTAHVTLNRYSSVVLRYNRVNRSVISDIIDGDPASDPLIPELTQNNDTYEIRIANIFVGAGVTRITDDDITDARSYTGGLVDVPDVSYRRYSETTDTDNRKYFDIPDEYNLTPNTFLQVYSDGSLCKQSDYYLQINEVEGNMMVVFNTGRSNGTTVEFIMIN